MATILIVDDRPANREFLATLLGYAGHRLLEAADGAEALSVAMTVKPDLVIADILMPTMDGYEFVRCLRADPSVAGIPVIFCTAHYHDQEARVLANACGVTHVLFKPCEPEVVLSTVDAVLGVAPAVVPNPPEEVFDREHLRILTDKLSQKADELRRTNERLTALVDLGLQLGSERDARRLLESFCHAARTIICARFAVVGVLNGDGSTVRHFFTSGMDAETAGRISIPDGRQGVLLEVLRDCRTLRAQNPGGDPAGLGLPTSYPPVPCWLGAPIMAPTRVYGWLGLIGKIGAEAFSEEDERLAGILAAQVGRIYENGSLYADLLRHASELDLEVAERKRQEAALRESEERFRIAFEDTNVGMVLLDTEHRIIRVNAAFAQVFGHAASDMLGMSMADVTHPGDLAESYARREVLQAGKAHYFQMEKRYLHKDGHVLWGLANVALVRDAQGLPLLYVGQLQDITERKQLENQYRQAQKMEAIGRLAGGVAHDFNNLLTVINCYSEMMLALLNPGDPLREYTEQILRAGKRAALLTRQLLAFSRKQVLLPVVLDLNTLLADMEKMLARVIGDDIELRFAADKDLWTVKVDSGQMEQVIMNLVVNARDAMPEGGKVTIETKNVELDDSYTAGHAEFRPGEYVLVAVCDTGIGMDAAIRARLFEPFFTTKGPEKGTGLGLATVYGIVKQSSGSIEVYSELGVGTTFKVYLPRSREALAAPRPAALRPPSEHGAETILLVEDADGVRSLVGQVLGNDGYTVLEASNGGEAIAVCQQHPERIDLLVTDVVMPNMSGRQLAEHLARLRPGLKVLYLSGYTDDAIVHHGVLAPSTAFLQKPFTPTTLARKVRETLDR